MHREMHRPKSEAQKFDWNEVNRRGVAEKCSTKPVFADFVTCFMIGGVMVSFRSSCATSGCERGDVVEQGAACSTRCMAWNIGDACLGGSLVSGRRATRALRRGAQRATRSGPPGKCQKCCARDDRAQQRCCARQRCRAECGLNAQRSALAIVRLRLRR